jgi:hypothetical protein
MSTSFSSADDCQWSTSLHSKHDNNKVSLRVEVIERNITLSTIVSASSNTGASSVDAATISASSAKDLIYTSVDG